MTASLSLIPRRSPPPAPAKTARQPHPGPSEIGPRRTGPFRPLSRLWQAALADEERHVAPFERMGLAVLAVCALATLWVAGLAARDFVGTLPELVRNVAALLGG